MTVLLIYRNCESTSLNLPSLWELENFLCRYEVPTKSRLISWFYSWRRSKELSQKWPDRKAFPEAIHKWSENVPKGTSSMIQRWSQGTFKNDEKMTLPRWFESGRGFVKLIKLICLMWIQNNYEKKNDEKKRLKCVWFCWEIKPMWLLLLGYATVVNAECTYDSDPHRSSRESCFQDRKYKYNIFNNYKIKYYNYYYSMVNLKPIKLKIKLFIYVYKNYKILFKLFGI